MILFLSILSLVMIIGCIIYAIHKERELSVEIYETTIPTGYKGRISDLRDTSSRGLFLTYYSSDNEYNREFHRLPKCNKAKIARISNSGTVTIKLYK